MDQNAVQIEAQKDGTGGAPGGAHYPELNNPETLASTRKLLQTQSNQVLPVNDGEEAELAQIEQQLAQGQNIDSPLPNMAEHKDEFVDKEYKAGIIFCICFSIPMGITLFFISNIIQAVLGALNLLMLLVMLVTMGKTKIDFVTFKFAKMIEAGGFVVLWGWITLLVGAGLLYLRWLIHKSFQPMALNKLKSFLPFKKEKFQSPTIEMRQQAAKGIFLYLVIHTCVLLLSIIGGIIAGNLTDFLFLDVVTYLTCAFLYIWMYVELKKYIAYANNNNAQ